MILRLPPYSPGFKPEFVCLEWRFCIGRLPSSQGHDPLPDTVLRVSDAISHYGKQTDLDFHHRTSVVFCLMRISACRIPTGREILSDGDVSVCRATVPDSGAGAYPLDFRLPWQTPLAGRVADLAGDSNQGLFSWAYFLESFFRKHARITTSFWTTAVETIPLGRLPWRTTCRPLGRLPMRATCRPLG